MIDRIDELQELIEWCKAKGVKRLKISDIEFEISDIGLSEKFLESETAVQLKDKESSSLSSQTLTDTETPNKDDEDLLFWSTR